MWAPGSVDIALLTAATRRQCRPVVNIPPEHRLHRLALFPFRGPQHAHQDPEDLSRSGRGCSGWHRGWDRRSDSPRCAPKARKVFLPALLKRVRTGNLGDIRIAITLFSSPPPARLLLSQRLPLLRAGPLHTARHRCSGDLPAAFSTASIVNLWLRAPSTAPREFLRFLLRANVHPPFQEHLSRCGRRQNSPEDASQQQATWLLATCACAISALRQRSRRCALPYPAGVVVRHKHAPG